ncbi:MAG: DUF4352 domain-containing protein [Anaerolineales bacterium]|nr:DUF4352 domain-containing protein [Anaerolineales bacterium]
MNPSSGRTPSIPSMWIGASALFFLLACSAADRLVATATRKAEETATLRQASPTGTTVPSRNPTATRTPAATPIRAGTPGIGVPFLICDTAVTVLGWEDVPPGEYFKPEPGNRFVAVEVVLVNLGSVPVDTGYFFFFLLDGHDEEMPLGLFSITKAHGTVLFGGLAPGERIRGKVGYETPEEEQAFSWKVSCYNVDQLEYEEWIVDLGSQPRSAPPPGRFEGETFAEPLPVGETALVRSVEITLNQALPYPEDLLDPDSRRPVSPPYDWMKYLIIDLTLANRGEAKAELTSFMDFYVRDFEGWRYGVIHWADRAVEDPFEDYFTLGWGERITGQLVFQVPADPRDLYFVFEQGYGRESQRAYFLLP